MVEAGFTKTYLAHFDNSDMSYDAVAAVNAATGELRILGFRNDP